MLDCLGDQCASLMLVDGPYRPAVTSTIRPVKTLGERQKVWRRFLNLRHLHRHPSNDATDYDPRLFNDCRSRNAITATRAIWKATRAIVKASLPVRASPESAFALVILTTELNLRPAGAQSRRLRVALTAMERDWIACSLQTHAVLP